MIDVVFLDAGETILRPHPSFAELFARVCSERGSPVSAADVRVVQERLAPHLTDLAEATGVENPSLSKAGSRKFWGYLYRRFLEELGLDLELADLLYATFSHPASYKLFDDVLDALDELQAAGYRLGLISNFEQWLEEMLVELEVGHLFEAVVISGVAGVEKPDSRIYEIALERVGVAAENAVHVGDSPSMDVEPARALGMHAVLLDRVGRYEGREFDAIRIASLKDLPQVISKL
ncbi:MAG: HAD family hydrolase [Actinomycetota bacterium]